MNSSIQLILLKNNVLLNSRLKYILLLTKILDLFIGDVSMIPPHTRAGDISNFDTGIRYLLIIRYQR